jgi:hypothetical protein
MDSIAFQDSLASKTGDIVPSVLYTKIGRLASTESNDAVQFPAVAMSTGTPNQAADEGIIATSLNMSRDPSFDPSIVASPSTAATSPLEGPSEALVLSIYDYQDVETRAKRLEELSENFKRTRMEEKNISLLRERLETLTKDELIRELETNVRDHARETDDYGKMFWEEKVDVDKIIKSLEQRLKEDDAIWRKRVEPKYKIQLKIAKDKAEKDHMELEKEISDLGVYNRQSDEKISNLNIDLRLSEDQNKRSAEKLKMIQKELEEWKVLAGSRLQEKDTTEKELKKINTEFGIQMVEATNENEKLKAEKQKMEAEIEDAKRRSGEERQEIRLKPDKANEFAVNQRKALAESNAECTKKVSEIKKLRGTIQDLATKKNALALEKKNLKDQKATLHDDLRKQAGLKSEFETLQADNKRLQKDFDKQAQKKKKLQEDLETQRSEKSEKTQIEKDCIAALKMKMEGMTKGYEVEVMALKLKIKERSDRSRKQQLGLCILLAILVVFLLLIRL